MCRAYGKGLSEIQNCKWSRGGTVNTLAPITLVASIGYCDSRLRLEEHLSVAYDLHGQLASLRLEPDTVSDDLEHDGVKMFIEFYQRLLVTLERRKKELAI